MIAEGLGALTSVMVLSRGPHWNIEKEKIDRIGTRWGAVIQYYFPDEAIGETSLVVGALMATGATFGPPLVVDIFRARATAATAAAARQRTRPQPPFTQPPAPEPYWQQPQPQPRTQPDMYYEPQTNHIYEPPPPTSPQPGDLPNMSEADLAQMAAMAQQAMQMMGFFGANGNSDTTNENPDTHTDSPN